MAEERKIVIDVEVQEKKATGQLGNLEKSIKKVQGGASKLTSKMSSGFGAIGKGAKGAISGVKGLAGGFKALAAATGFVFNNGQWVPTRFRSGEKYIFKQVRADTADLKWRRGDLIWSLTEVGHEDRQSSCSSSGVNIICEGIFKVTFNRSTMRMLSAYFAGYVEGQDSNANTPVLSIGNCAPM